MQLLHIKELRKEKGLTQKEAAAVLSVPLRTYVNYENDPAKGDTIKYQYMLEKLEKYGYIDEEHGILSVELISKRCKEIFQDYPVEYCYLFGSYAKGKATEQSDVDLLVSASVKGLAFYELAEQLRTGLKKQVDLLGIEQLTNNPVLVQEILREGIKIYG